MKMRLAFLTVLLAVSYAVCAAFAVFAEDDVVYTEGTLYYTVSNESITITGCFGKDAEVTVPAIIAGIPVNTVASGAFTGNKRIQKLNLPDTITVIQDGAIDPAIKVIYNANTEHPQDTPTDIILAHMTSALTDETTADAAAETPADTSGRNPAETTDPAPQDITDSPAEPVSAEETTQTAAVSTETPIGGGELDDTDDTSSEDSAPASNTSDPDKAPSGSGTEQDTPGTQAPENDPDESGRGGKNKANALIWAIPCGAAVAAGAAAVIAVKKKKQK